MWLVATRVVETDHWSQNLSRVSLDLLPFTSYPICFARSSFPFFLLCHELLTFGHTYQPGSGLVTLCLLYFNMAVKPGRLAWELSFVSNKVVAFLNVTYLGEREKQEKKKKRQIYAAAAAAAKSLQSCPTLCNPIDGSPPNSPVPGILQARTLEWVAISFSNAWKWKVKVKLLSHVWLLATPWTAAYQAPPSMGFSRHEYWSGVPLPSPDKYMKKYIIDQVLWSAVIYGENCRSPRIKLE